jgi:Putative peptidoglycan-binding domain-containing protein
MASKCNLIIQEAKEQIGYTEKKGNITKYAAEIDKLWPDFYNTKKQGAEWCDIFVDWLFLHCFGEEAALYMLCQPTKSCGAGCKYSAQYYRKYNRFDREPKAGDQIFFGRSGEESHTGLVISVDDTKVYTIEGNSGNKVQEHWYWKTSSKISGYGHPRYDEEKGDTCMIEVKLCKNGNKNETVKSVQAILNSKGFKGSNGKALTLDGDFGPNTLYAVKSFQKANNLAQDGVVGPKTWTKLLG